MRNLVGDNLGNFVSLELWKEEEKKERGKFTRNAIHKCLELKGEEIKGEERRRAFESPGPYLFFLSLTSHSFSPLF